MNARIVQAGMLLGFWLVVSVIGWLRRLEPGAAQMVFPRSVLLPDEGTPDIRAERATRAEPGKGEEAMRGWILVVLDSGKKAHIRRKWVAKVEYGYRDRQGSHGQTVPIPTARIFYIPPGASEVLTVEGADDVNLLHELLDSQEGRAAA